jgi:hypothetical protein
MSSTDDTVKSKPYRTPTPLIIKSTSPITITDGKFTIVHSGNIVFHGNFVEFELEETQKTLLETKQKSREGQTELPSSFNMPEGYKFLVSTESKSVAWDQKRSRYETYKRDKDLSYITIIRRNGSSTPPIRLGSLLDPTSMISMALKEFSKTPTFLRRDIKVESLPMSLAQGQRVRACLDVLENEGFFTKTSEKVGPKRTIDKYVRTDKKLE